MPTDIIAPAADLPAFGRYQQTDAYRSTAKQISGNVEGCLWAAFYAGRQSVAEELAEAKVVEALETAIKEKLEKLKGGDAT